MPAIGTPMLTISATTASGKNNQPMVLTNILETGIIHAVLAISWACVFILPVSRSCSNLPYVEVKCPLGNALMFHKHQEIYGTTDWTWEKAGQIADKVDESEMFGGTMNYPATIPKPLLPNIIDWALYRNTVSIPWSCPCILSGRLIGL